MKSCSQKVVSGTIIGERERANLVVQLARFLYFPILRFYGHAVTVNRSDFTYTVSRTCANIYRCDLRVICTSWQVCGKFELHGLYSCSLYYSCQHCVFFACKIHKQPVLQSSSSCISLLTPPSVCHTLVGSLLLANNGQHSASTFCACAM